MDQELPSVNALTAPLVEDLVTHASALRLTVSRLDNGTRIIDAGIKTSGGLEAGRRIGEICMGGLGTVRIKSSKTFTNWPWSLDVYSSNPVLSCLASQYAGWSLNHGKGQEGFNALGSGPARAMGSNEELYKELNYKDKGESACLVIEVDKLPPIEIADKIATRCGIKPENLTLILTPTQSLAGAVQVVARVLEVALHKIHALHFPLEAVIDGAGTAPICPPTPNFIKAMGRTNDAILFGGQVHLFVNASDEDAKDLAHKLPCISSKDYGRPFAEIFKAVNYDFYQIDAMLFSPALVSVTSLTTGKTYHHGMLNPELLEKSFG
jgi:methenyltetrahydromethanopterin cyclohydrolase